MEQPAALPAEFPACRPDYAGGGFLNLIASLGEACGAPPRHATLAALPRAELAAARNLVLVILDGLGDGYLAAHGPGGHLLRHRRGSISAVFPSTTAAAITTSLTGASPLEHGLTGWFGYFREAGCVAAPLPFYRRGDQRPLTVAPGRVFVAPPLVDALDRDAVVVSQASIVHSTYNRHHCGRAERRPYADLGGFVAQVAAAVKASDARKFVYAYWPEFDTLSHRHGVASAEVRAQFERLDAAFGDLLLRLAGTDSLVVATADHGFLDCARDESLELPARLASLLRLPLCGERRLAFCHVQEGRIEEFVARARDWLGARARVLPSALFAAEGWFGPGRAHPDFAERIGDVALVMGGRYTVKDWVTGESRHLHVGNHGGASADEMRIPLLVAKT